jgi:uncharacterized membrane protein
MENTFITKITSNIKSGGFHASHVLNPHKHWKVLLSIFSLITLLLVVFSFYLLYKIKNEQIFRANPTSSEGGVVIKEKLIKSVTDTFDQKTTKENSIKSNPPMYLDPSL